jgi:hypothetical protein
MPSARGALYSVAHLTFAGVGEPAIQHTGCLFSLAGRHQAANGSVRDEATSIAVTIAIGRAVTPRVRIDAKAANGGRWSYRRRWGKPSYRGAQPWLEKRRTQVR